ncbi:methionyl-tRNA formyltransferase [Actinomyces sp. zg-332]|uniref:methionyl-tRNA formyltransferase n=1 Tax=Actinomyces sp. zg-332 TaxID=2708340 RepID=UPI00141E9393|nr:methionyl-tRNA formyltransferase [Actinomyces sp. zg-332]QPK94618.1 methionyl-tRNA formyltransferase [Actinomyces sp. zg-332]
MRILFAGTPKNAVPTLQALIDSEHEIVAVLTRPPAPSGRGRKLVESEVSIKAKENNIPVLTLKSLKDEQSQQIISDLHCDVAVVVAYGNLIPKKVLEMPKYGWINLHFSLLPRWRGAAPVQYAVMNSDTVTGACVFQLEQGLDTGPVYASLQTSVGEKTSSELLEELGSSGAGLVLESLDKILAGQTPLPQPEEGVTLAPKIPSNMGEIDFNKSATEIEALVRAVTDQPGAYTFIDNKRIKIAPLTLAEENDLAPGELKITKRSVYVGTKTNNLLLTRVAPSGKSWMNAADWARGLRGEKYFGTND